MIEISPTYSLPMAPSRRLAQQIPIKILTKQEIEEAQSLGQRLADTASALMAAAPIAKKNPSALAAYLGVDRTASKRLFAAVAEIDETTIARAAGPRSLRLLADAAENKEIDDRVVVQLRQVADAFDAYLVQIGGTQRTYMERLRRTREGPDEIPQVVRRPRHTAPTPGGSFEARRTLFEAASKLSGHSSDMQFRMAVLRPSEKSEGYCDTVRAWGHIGYRQARAKTPFISVHAFPRNASGRLAQFSPLKGAMERGVPSLLLEEFSSSCWRNSSFIDDEMLYCCIEPSDSMPMQGDIVQANVSFGTVADRRWIPDGSQEFWLSIQYPSRRAIVDVYLHVDMAQRCTISADAHAMIHIPRNEEEQRATRIGQPSPLLFLGLGTQASSTPAYPRHIELTDHLFNSLGWNPRDFLGFRYEVEYPLWHVGYRVSFDFKKRA